MNILALEFSSDQKSVAVLNPGIDRATALNVEVVETGGRATRALGMTEEALRQAGVEREAIECLAIGLGPGSYNGIRVALALAQGWQLARGVRLLGISSAECIVAQAQAEGLRGRVGAVIDAQRGEFYLANFEIDSTGWRELQPLRLASPPQVEAAQTAGDILVGPEVTKWFPSGRIVLPRAATLARLAVGRTDFVPGEKLAPIYLRETNFVKAPPSRPLPL